ncbi:hypothetical protein Clacol_000317 [Clathrus columnatus]|uniref:Uncharacterized protein n=1 Tax=Clathrus columnatus TaxID=1419009 RepID=A0AAV4ZZ00_9AGAM|nr:hypothetical protein Clacol_000317 [Clathrus columnatus]
MTELDDDNEHTPLIHQQSRPQQRLLSQFTILIPIALATRCASFLPSTTIIQIVETFVCRLWYETHHQPGRFPDAEACKIAPVKERFAGTMAALTTTETYLTEVFAAVLCNATIGYFASRYGRKPVILVLMGVNATGLLTILSFNLINGSNILPLLAVRMVAHGVGELIPLVLNMIVVDVVAPNARTPKVSAMIGWGVLGIIGLAFSSGGQPACRSLVVSLIEPVLQAEALSALETVGSLGTMLSPILLGTIFAKTVATAPMTAFYTHGAVVMAAASILFLVKDQDKYEATTREREAVIDEGESPRDI